MREEWSIFADWRQSRSAVRYSAKPGCARSFTITALAMWRRPTRSRRFLDADRPRRSSGWSSIPAITATASGGRDVIEGLRAFSKSHLVHPFQGLPSQSRGARPSRAIGITFEALRHGVFCELGLGCVDFPAVLRWMRETGYAGYALVEQDVLPGMGAPEESARRIGNICAPSKRTIRLRRGVGGRRMGGSASGSSARAVSAGACGNAGASPSGGGPGGHHGHQHGGGTGTGAGIRYSPCRGDRGRDFERTRYRCGPDLLLHRDPRRASWSGRREPASTSSARSRSTTRLEKIDRALEAVAKAGVKLQVGFNRRFDANFMRVRQAVESGRDRYAASAAHRQPRSGAAADLHTWSLPAACSWT